MGYQPFLIAPFKMGLDNDLDPWMLPPDAFVNIKDGHIKHGVTEKRKGYRLLAEMVHTDDKFAITGITLPGDPVVLTVTSTTGNVLPVITNGQRIQINYVEGMTELNGNQYLASVVTGTTIKLQDLQGIDIDGSAFTAWSVNGQVSIFPADRIMGLPRYIAFDNSKSLLAMDTTRVAIYNSTNESFEPLSQTDIVPAISFIDVFSSNDTNYIWSANWASISGSAGTPLIRLYFTNGKEYSTAVGDVDGIWYYTSASAQTVTIFRPVINTDFGGPFLNGCKFIFAIRQRLLCLSTFEGGEDYPQRARWCQQQNPDAAKAWDDATPGKGGYVDCPTGEHIISAAQIQDTIIVLFTSSVWTLRPTADPALPFRWDKVNSFRACDAKMAVASFDKFIVSLGQRGIIASNPVESERIDERIESFTTVDVNSDEFDKIFALRSFGLKRTWILYPRTDATDCDYALIYDEDSKSFSKYEIALNVLGYGGIEKDMLLSEFPISPNDNPNNDPIQLDNAGNDTIRAFFWQNDSDIFIGGTRDGKVQVLETSDDDGGSSIGFELESASWNPYKEQGVQCQFGYIDFYVETHPDTRATIRFYKDNMKDEYAERTIDFLPNLREGAAITQANVLTDPTLGFEVTAPQHGLVTNDIRYLYGIEGAEYLNGGPYTTTVVSQNKFTISQNMEIADDAITGITQASPGVVTQVGNSFANGDEIYFRGIEGMIELNFTGENYYTVANGTDVSYQLKGIDTSIDHTAWSAGGFAFKRYSNQGVITELPFEKTRAWKRAYAGGTGWSHKITVTSEGVDRPVRIIAYMPHFKKRGKRLI